MTEPIPLLRKHLSQKKLDGFILPVNDEFMGEYVPASAKRLTWLTGFTGSAGMAVVLKNKAAFFTDGRYTLQAEAEVKDCTLFNSGDMAPEKWLSVEAKKGTVIGYDPRLHTLSALRRYERAASHIIWKPVMPNPVDILWENRPSAPQGVVKVHPLKYAGEASQIKRERIAKDIMGQGADFLILTAPDSLCWLLNVRGDDVPYTPFVLCNAIMDKSGKLTMYLDRKRVSEEVVKHLGSGVTVKVPEKLVEDLAKLKNKKVMYDPAGSPVWFYQQLVKAKANVMEYPDPCQLPKACKNSLELTGMRNAHVRDGLAVTRFLCWLDNAVAGGQPITEMTVAEKLESFRKVSDSYLCPSFTTISGSAANGAIVHYRVTEKTNRLLENDSLLLLDSGGQYADGTTDITRTIALGKPSAEMKENFTRVLKGHIAIATAVFPEGTSGSQIDALARQYLWQAGLDYDHGTGHGVGSYLSVHEGPQRISKRGGDAPLEPGMIVSNEPGYYKAGAYGIRIESLVAVKEVKISQNGRRYLGFETITLVPVDLRLVDKKMLDARETEWLQKYHRRIYETHFTNLDNEEKEWLGQACVS